MKCISLAIVILFLSVNVCFGNVFFVDGNSLLRDLKNKNDTVDQSYSLGYIHGVADSLDRRFFDIPEGVTGGQLVEGEDLFIVSEPIPLLSIFKNGLYPPYG